MSEYVPWEGGRAERWTQRVAGGAGELGGARGEALTFRHEMLLARAPGDVITPLQYVATTPSRQYTIHDPRTGKYKCLNLMVNGYLFSNAELSPLMDCKGTPSFCLHPRSRF